MQILVVYMDPDTTIPNSVCGKIVNLQYEQVLNIVITRM